MHICFEGHSGKEFIIAFPENYGNLSYAQVLITTMTDTSVTIESPNPGVNRVINVTAARGATVNLPVSLMLRGNTIKQKGVLLRSPEDIAVYVSSQYSSTKGEAYAAIPVHKLGTSYIGAAYAYSFVTIVAYQDNTHVNITPGYRTQSYNGKYYNNGDTINVYLARLSTFQIKGNSYSYNTDITSDKPIAVLSGAMCYDIQQNSISITYCNHVVESIPPLKSLGSNFIIPPILGTNYTFYFSYNSDTKYHVNFYGKAYNYSAFFNRYNDLERHSNIPYVYKFSKPGVVVQYTINYNSDIYPAKIVIPAISQYSNNYKYITPSVYTFDNYVAIMIKSDDANGLQFDERTIFRINPVFQSITVDNVLYNVISLNVTAGQHTAHHVDPHVTFGMIAYGFRPGQAYGFPVGLRL